MDQEKTWCVYMHTNKINGKKYIGLTSQHPPEKRWKKNGSGYRCGYFKNAINKYGWENFEHTILEDDIPSLKEANRLEHFYVEKYNTKIPNGYNLTDGGDGTKGIKPSDDFKKRQSIIHKEQWQDEEFKERMLQYRQNPNGVYKSQEFRDKISKIVSGKNNPNYGNHWTQEQKDRLREKQKQNPIYKNEQNPNAKRIRCKETGEIFECIKFAKEKYGIKSDGSLTVALKNPNRTAAKMHWEYLPKSDHSQVALCSDTY